MSNIENQTNAETEVQEQEGPSPAKLASDKAKRDYAKQEVSLQELNRQSGAEVAARTDAKAAVDLAVKDATAKAVGALTEQKLAETSSENKGETKAHVDAVAGQDNSGAGTSGTATAEGTSGTTEEGSTRQVAGKTVEKATFNELKDFAAEKGIDFAEVQNKGQAIEAVNAYFAAEEAKAAEAAAQ